MTFGNYLNVDSGLLLRALSDIFFIVHTQMRWTTRLKLACDCLALLLKAQSIAASTYRGVSAVWETPLQGNVHCLFQLLSLTQSH